MATGRLPDPNSAPVTSKGDLYTYSTRADRLAVGNNGDTLVADSSTTTGLRYNPAVGSLANPVINGGMDVWQRGTSFTGTTSGTYTADRWTVGSAANWTVSRQNVGDSTNLPSIQFCARVQRNSGSTSTSVMNFVQSWESSQSIPFAGRTVTLSFYARAGANYSSASSALNVSFFSGTGTDQSAWGTYTGATAFINSSVTLTTTWQRFALTGTIASTATELTPQFNFTPVGTAGANDWFEITGVQVDIGTWTASTAPAFRRSGGTLAGELQAAQRYYWRAGGDSVNQNFGIGVSTSTTNAYIQVNMPVEMRVAPTAVEYSTLEISDRYAVGAVPTAITIATNAKLIVGLNATISGSTQGRMQFLKAANSTSAYLALTAEL